MNYLSHYIVLLTTDLNALPIASNILCVCVCVCVCVCGVCVCVCVCVRERERDCLCNRV